MKNSFEKRIERIKRRGEQQKEIYELQQEYNQYYPSRNGMRVSNLVLIVVIIAILLYTAAAFYLQFSENQFRITEAAAFMPEQMEPTSTHSSRVCSPSPT